jgi:hypothetical protein
MTRRIHLCFKDKRERFKETLVFYPQRKIPQHHFKGTLKRFLDNGQKKGATTPALTHLLPRSGSHTTRFIPEINEWINFKHLSRRFGWDSNEDLTRSVEIFCSKECSPWKWEFWTNSSRNNLILLQLCSLSVYCHFKKKYFLCYYFI